MYQPSQMCQAILFYSFDLFIKKIIMPIQSYLRSNSQMLFLWLYTYASVRNFYSRVFLQHIALNASIREPLMRHAHPY